MAKKSLKTYEQQRLRKNERQREYRRENPELWDAWRQRSSANYLRKKGWKVVEPPDWKTPEMIRERRDTMAQIDSVFDPDDFNVTIDELPWP